MIRSGFRRSRLALLIPALAEEHALRSAATDEAGELLPLGENPPPEFVRYGAVLAGVEALAKRRGLKRALAAVEGEADQRVHLVLLQRHLDQPPHRVGRGACIPSEQLERPFTRNAVPKLPRLGAVDRTHVHEVPDADRRVVRRIVVQA